MTIPAFCMPWHVTQSDAFRKILVEPLHGLLDIALTAWDESPDLPLRTFARAPDLPQVFCQLPPPAELLGQAGARVVWLPMWDEAARWPGSFWQGLPGSLRIVALCEPVERLAQKNRLPCLRLRFFLDPEDARPVCWGKERTLLYWNRVGLYSPGALRRICRDLHVEKLVHVYRPDPRFNRPDLTLPETIGRTRVLVVRDHLPEPEHRQLLEECPLALAPRPLEGVGLAVLQSLVRGACVLACNAPSMNEYIEHRRTGYLFRSCPRRLHAWRKSILKRWSRWFRPGKPFFYHLVAQGQVGSKLKRIEPEKLGASAREEHKQGRKAWLQGVSAFASFIEEW